jgi:hypothetical protein
VKVLPNAYKAAKPDDANLIIFLSKDNDTIRAHENKELTQQIKMENRGLASFSDCLTPVMSSGVIRGAIDGQTGWLTLR